MFKLYRSIGITLALILIAGAALTVHIKIDLGKTEAEAKATNAVTTPSFSYNFAGQKIIEEAGSPSESDDPFWWIESGAELKIQNGIGRTLEGNLPAEDAFRTEYAQSAPVASDNGYHPQNIFRMITKKEWQDFEQTMYVKVLGDNLFNPSNSHEWNGISLLARYQDENNYYYMGIRMDGQAVIKKKKNGQFSTLDINQLFDGEYDSALTPNLIPKDQKMGIRSRILNGKNGSVTLQLYVDEKNNGNWTLAAEAVDTGGNGGTLSKSGAAGIFTDYMNVEFSNYKVNTLGSGTAVNNGNSDTAAGDGTSTDEPDTTVSTSTDPVINEGNSTSTNTSTGQTGRNGRRGGTGSSATTTSAGSSSETPAPAPAPAPKPSSDDGATGGTANAIGQLLVNRTLQEVGSMSESGDKDWWLNSGGYVYFKDGIGSTIHGDLSSSDKWYKEYASSNPEDTDNGSHPQNLFRLVSKSTNWKDYVQQVSFKLDKYNLSDSGERDGFNGMLFFNRYVDGDNLYYTGIRVDGNLEIKKKKNGTYYTMLIAPVFPGKYDRSSNPNLLPVNKWIGFRTRIEDTADGKVNIKVYVDKTGSGDYQLFGEATDDGKQYGGAVMNKAASVGIRTDFMDAQFKDYTIQPL